jgi:hypothetical protein
MRHALATMSIAGTVLLLAACSLPTSTATTPNLPETPVPTPPVSVPVPTTGPSTLPPVNSPSAVPPVESPSPVPATPSAASPTTATAAPNEQPAASRPGTFQTVKVTAQLYPIRRSGGTASVDLYITSNNPDDTFKLWNNLSDGNTETGSADLSAVDGIRLIDTAGKKAYLPAVTADGDCVCSPNADNTFDERSSVWVSVTFAAPPASVTAMSVSVPSFGSFSNVPVI